MITIVCYSNQNYQYLAQAMLASVRHRCGDTVRLVYYTIDFDSTLEFPMLTKVRWELNPLLPKWEFYKAGIIWDAFHRFPGQILYLDVDLMVGRRFQIENFVQEASYPIGYIGNWDRGLRYWTLDITNPFPVFKLNDRVVPVEEGATAVDCMGTILDLYPDNQTYLVRMDNGRYRTVSQSGLVARRYADNVIFNRYLGLDVVSKPEVMTAVLSFSSACEEFILEWKAFSENEYLLRNWQYYLPFPDQTILNTLLWKRDVEHHYGRVLFNSFTADAAILVETRDDLVNVAIDNNQHCLCWDSSKISFYHGIINPDEVTKLLQYLTRSV